LVCGNGRSAGQELFKPHEWRGEVH
jgi:hypothetical protein